MKRHGFGGLPATHGTSVSHRSHGGTGARQDPGRVFKGKKMAGRMGGVRRTQQNLQVFKIDTKLNLIYVRGCIPGASVRARARFRFPDACSRPPRLFAQNTYVLVADSIKKRFAAPPPFPTVSQEALSALPRELVVTSKGPDPLLEEIDV